MMDLLTDTSAIDYEIEELVREAEDVTTLTRKCIEKNAVKAQSQKEFAARYKSYEDRYEGIKKKVEKLQEQKAQRQVQAESISAFMFVLHETDEPVTEFDSKLWLSVIDHVLVTNTGVLAFRFRNGTEVEA